MQALILSAGRGTRLKPFTNIRSKAMAPILNKPIVFRVMETLWQSGVHNFIVVKSPDDKKITTYLLKNIPNYVKIDFVTQKNRDGVVGAILCAKDYVKDDFIISACDSLKKQPFIDSFLKHFSDGNHFGVVAVMKADKESIIKSSAVETDRKGYVTKIIEKPSLEKINTNNLGLPLYVFKKDLFKHFHEVKTSERGEKEIQDFINIVVNRYGMVSTHTTDTRHTITTVEDLINVNAEFFEYESVKKSEIAKSRKTLHIKQPVLIDEGFLHGTGCSVGPNVVIEKNVSLGDNVKISNSLILSDSTVPDNAILNNEVYFTTDN